MHLSAGLMVAGDHAGHRLLVGHRLPDSDRDLAAGAEPAAPGRVVDLDRHRAHAQQVALLPRPRELLQGRSPEASGEDLLEGIALALVGALVEVEVEVPRRARLVVVVAAREDDVQPGEVELPGPAALDLP